MLTRLGFTGANSITGIINTHRDNRERERGKNTEKDSKRLRSGRDCEKQFVKKVGARLPPSVFLVYAACFSPK